MASPDLGNWIVKGDLLLTSLYELNWSTQKKLIDHVIEFGASGIVVKLNEFLKSVPSQLIQYCQQQSVPLIEVRDVVFRTILQNFTHLAQKRRFENETAFDTKVLLPLLNGTADQSQIQSAMNHLEIQNNSEVILAQLQQPIAETTELNALVKRIRSTRIPVLIGVVNDCLTVLLPKRQIKTNWKNFLTEIFSDYSIITSQSVAVDQLHIGYRQIIAAKIVCSSSFEPKALYVFNHFGIEQLFFKATLSDLDTIFSVPELTNLYHQDNVLFKSFYGYLYFGQNITQTARHLFIHPKTLTYRLHKLSKLFSIDLANQNSMLYLSCSIRYVYLKEAQLLHLPI